MGPANLLMDFFVVAKQKPAWLDLKDRRIGAPSNVLVSRILCLHVWCCEVPLGPRSQKETAFSCGRSPCPELKAGGHKIENIQCQSHRPLVRYVWPSTSCRSFSSLVPRRCPALTACSWKLGDPVEVSLKVGDWLGSVVRTRRGKETPPHKRWMECTHKPITRYAGDTTYEEHSSNSLRGKVIDDTYQEEQKHYVTGANTRLGGPGLWS